MTEQTQARHPKDATPDMTLEPPAPPAPPVTGEPGVDAALAAFVVALPEGLDAHAAAGATLDAALRGQLQGLASAED